MDAGGHNQGIVRVLIQMVIGFCEQSQTGRIPDDLIDPNYFRFEVFGLVFTQPTSGQPDQKNGVAVGRAQIDSAVKRNREPRLKIEEPSN